MNDFMRITAEMGLDTAFDVDEKAISCDNPDIRDVTFRVWNDRDAMTAFLHIRLVMADDLWEAVELADQVDQELYDGIVVVTKFCRDEGIEKGTFGYIHTLYVLPEYRQLGLGSTLLKQLPGLLYMWFDIKLVAASVKPAITDVIVKDNYVSTSPKMDPLSEDDEKLLGIMKKNLEVCGFIPTNYASFSNDQHWCKIYKKKSRK